MGITVTVSLEWLFAVFGSNSTALTDAAFVTLGAAAASTETVSEIVDDAAAARPAALVHVTSAPAALQVHPIPLPETNVSPAGNGSVTVTAPEATGPAFAIASVKLPFWPTVNVPACVFEIDTSAESTMSSEADDVVLGKYVQVSRPLTSPNEPVHGTFVLLPTSPP